MTSSADPLRSSNRVTTVDLFGSAPAEGAHEVIANHPEHRTRLIELGADGLAEAMAAWRARLAAHSATAPYVQLIVNEGAAAGASLSHSHAQLYALPFVPAEVARERERFNAYHERTLGSHLLEDVIVEEVRSRERLVAVDEEAILFCPWASRSPFELRLAPRSPAPRFEDDERGAAMLLTALGALETLFGDDAAAQPLGADGAARDRGVPLAHRHRAPARDQGGLRARHRRRHRLLPAGAGRGRSARGAGPASCRGRIVCSAMPPIARPFPRFVADTAQEARPYGDWEERLGAAFAEACAPLTSEGAEAPVDVSTLRLFPERTWGRRTYVPDRRPRFRRRRRHAGVLRLRHLRGERSRR